MLAFKRILFPVDFSARCDATVPSVRAMAARFGAEVTVLHVVDMPPAGIAPPEAAAWATLIGADRLREQGKIALGSFIDRAFAGVPVNALAEEGDPATVIADYARENQTDLVMMPTSGLGTFRRLLLGSVTAKVLHDCGIPVWTGVHASELEAHRPDQWQRVICAIDDTERDLHVLQWAAQFACEQKLQLRLVHAVRGPEECEKNAAFREFLFTVAQEGIDNLQTKAGTNLELCMQLGNPGPVIHRTAIGFNADMLIIGRGAMQRTFGRLRSGAYEIIREAPCPVISV